MIKTILLGETEEKFKASAATSILYKRLFKEDILEILSNYSKKTKEIRELQEELAKVKELPDSEEKEAQLADVTSKLLPLNSFVNDFFTRFAYITWLEANVSVSEIFKKLTEEEFFAWLLAHESKDFTSISGELIKLWTENTKATVKPKN